MMIRRTQVLVAFAAVALFWACRGGPERASGAHRPRPLLALATQSRARQVTGWHEVPPGPGAEGRLGDFVLENAQCRFIVAAAAANASARPGGCLIDAALQGGEDRIRALVPLMGSGRALPAIWQTVKVEAEGGVNLCAIVKAEGYLPGRPQVRVTTTYKLYPDSPALQITTSVRNDGGDVLKDCKLRDLLYHGRTLRFAPGAVPGADGVRSSSTWMASFWDGQSWGVLGSPLEPMAGFHDPGGSELHHGTVDVPPGSSRSYTRQVVAVAGGPEAVWLLAYPVPEQFRSRLVVELKDLGTSEPVSQAEVVVAPAEGASPVLAVTDAEGRASLEMRGGRYAVSVRAPGRAVPRPVEVPCAAGRTHRLGLTLPAAATAKVAVRARVGEFASPAAARVSSCNAGLPPPPCPAAPAFPIDVVTEVALAAPAAPAVVALTPLAADRPGTSLVLASKGPLFESAVQRITAAQGRALELDLSVERVVDPGLYAAVDVRQHTESSLDCALTLAEAAFAGACEGLDAAVVSDPVWRAPLGGVQQHTECRLLRSLRVSVPGVGRFSVFPIEEARGGMPDPDQGLGGTGGEVLSHLRQAFPDALIQVDRPLDPREGYLALNRIDPGRNLLDLQEVACGFDAVEVLSGRDVAGARLMLKAWFRMLNDGRKVIATGGSGSRTVTAEEGGGARTFVYCPRAAGSPTADEIARALMRLKEEPNAFVTNGPFVDVTLNGRPIGSTQQAPAGKAQMRLRVSAPAWIDVRRATIYRNGEVAQQLALEEPTKPLRCDRVVELDASRDCWFAVVVEGDRPMWPVYCGGADAPTPFAATNPFWVDADGDGQVRPAG